MLSSRQYIDSGTDKSLLEVDCYKVCDDGSVVRSTTGGSDVYIDDSDTRYLSDATIMLYIKNKHGSRVGVMRNSRNVLVSGLVEPINANGEVTPKMLLGVKRKSK